MGIQELTIKGFRSLREVTWSPGRLNVIIGPNGSGKSNLMRALALLQGAARGDLSQQILRMGGIAHLLWDGQVDELSWAVRTDAVDNGDPMSVGQGDMARPKFGRTDAVDNGDPMTYKLHLHQLGGTSAYRVEREVLVGHRRHDAGSYLLLDRWPGHALLFDPSPPGPTELGAHVPDEQALLALAGGPLGRKEVSRFCERLAGWAMYHDVRVDQGAALRQAAVARLDRQVAEDGQNLVPALHTLYTGDREFKRTLDDAMRAAFSQEYEELVFPPAADQRIQLRVRWRSLKSEQSATDLSDGTIRFLLLIAILANPNPPEVIAIDEPEIGLHPGMMPIIAEHAVEASTRTQVILTTHSTQLLDAFTETPPTTTVARWEDGETQLSVLDGEALKRWLAEYSLGALFRSGELEGMA